MRIVNNKLEYILNCQCGLNFAYDSKDLNQMFQCPQCHNQHHLNGTHDIYMLEKVNVVFPDREDFNKKWGVSPKKLVHENP